MNLEEIKKLLNVGEADPIDAAFVKLEIDLEKIELENNSLKAANNTYKKTILAGVNLIFIVVMFVVAVILKSVPLAGGAFFLCICFWFQVENILKVKIVKNTIQRAAKSIKNIRGK